MADAQTRELQIEQVRREFFERKRADGADVPHDERTHERRAGKHSYLREKLAERGRSEEQNG